MFRQLSGFILIIILSSLIAGTTVSWAGPLSYKTLTELIRPGARYFFANLRPGGHIQGLVYRPPRQQRSLPMWNRVSELSANLPPMSSTPTFPHLGNFALSGLMDIPPRGGINAFSLSTPGHIPDILECLQRQVRIYEYEETEGSSLGFLQSSQDNGESSVTQIVTVPPSLSLLGMLVNPHVLEILEEEQIPLTVFTPHHGIQEIVYAGMQEHSQDSEGVSVIAPHQHTFLVTAGEAPLFRWTRMNNRPAALENSILEASGSQPAYFITFLLNPRGQVVMVIEATRDGWIELVRQPLIDSLNNGRWDFPGNDNDPPPPPPSAPSAMAF